MTSPSTEGPECLQKALMLITPSKDGMKFRIQTACMKSSMVMSNLEIFQNIYPPMTSLGAQGPVFEEALDKMKISITFFCTVTRTCQNH